MMIRATNPLHAPHDHHGYLTGGSGFLLPQFPWSSTANQTHREGGGVDAKARRLRVGSVLPLAGF